MVVMIESRRNVAKACAYSCRQCLDFDGFGEFGELRIEA